MPAAKTTVQYGFTVNQKDLLRELVIVLPATSTATTLPVLANILLKVESQELVLAATNLEHGIISRLPVQNHTNIDWATTVPARAFHDLVKTLEGAIEIRYSEQDSKLEVVCGKSKSVLKALSAEEFPSLPKVAQYETAISAQAFRAMAAKAVYAAASDDVRPALTGINIHGVEQGLRLEAADGYRAARTFLHSDGKNGAVKLQKLNGLIPSRSVSEMMRVFSDNEQTIMFTAVKNMLVAHDGRRTVLANTISSAFPELEQIFPKTWSTTITVDRAALLTSLRQALIFAREGSSRVHLEARETIAALSSDYEETGSHLSELPAEIKKVSQNAQSSINLNVRFFIDAVNAAKSPRIAISIVAKDQPVVIKEENSSDYVALIMPMFGDN